MNLSEDAARMRVERALEKLQALLGKHDVTSTASALGIALAHQAVATAPAGLAASVTATALSGVAATASVLAPVLVSYATWKTKEVDWHLVDPQLRRLMSDAQWALYQSQPEHAIECHLRGRGQKGGEC